MTVSPTANLPPLERFCGQLCPRRNHGLTTGIAAIFPFQVGCGTRPAAISERRVLQIVSMVPPAVRRAPPLTSTQTSARETLSTRMKSLPESFPCTQCHVIQIKSVKSISRPTLAAC